MNVRRRVCRVLSAATIALCAVPAVGLIDAPHAGAASVSGTAYWVKLGIGLPLVPKNGVLVGDDPTAAINPSQPPPLPVPLPVALPPIKLPGPQLYGYTAVSALRIVGVPANADVTMTLPLAPGSIPPLPSVSTIVACPLVSDFNAPKGGVGDITAAPPDDCNTPSVGRLAATSLSISWVLPASFQRNAGELDIELQPGVAAVPFPYLVAFADPAPATFKAVAGGPLPTTAPPVQTPDSVVPFVPAVTPAPSSSPTPSPILTPSVTAAPSLPSPSVRTPSVTPINRLAQLTVSGVNDDRAHRIMAVVVLFVIAAAWWWLGGRATRGPRRLGALAGDAPVAAEDLGGIGRFRRTRAGPPPRI